MYRYEVEVKARVRDERALRERLKEIAIFKKERGARTNISLLNIGVIHTNLSA